MLLPVFFWGNPVLFFEGPEKAGIVLEPVLMVHMADGLVGQDAGYVAAELQRRLQDALLTDDRITGLKNYEYSIDGQNLTVSFTVETVYGDVETGTEVKF